MEAAAARAAARDRWGEMSRGHGGPSQLQRFIQQACSPENYEPNLAVNLEIVDLINSKKGTAPREAAVAIVNYINHRNPNVALLALSLLDICVKNCGYPFHLQISTKEFLNELVRRFPERPPTRPTKVQAKILEAIEEWRGTICDTSRYREDLGFIRDMHRLLSYKGYSFPEVRREDAAVLNPSDNLKSAEEMEEEEKEAQSAKLQELIRRGTPEDLQEANRLMKIMAGFDTRTKVDYRAKAAEEVSKIQVKARLLEERLEQFKQGDKMTEGDVFEELASALSSAQPKIQKMCEEDSDDHEAVAKLLEINDSIHRTVERYRMMKRGDMEGAKKLAEGAPIPQTSTGKDMATSKLGAEVPAAAELSLIDFDSAPPAGDLISGGEAPSSSKPAGVENDLLGLSLGDTSNNGGSFGQGGGIALGFGENTNIPGPALLSSLTESNTAKAKTPSPTPLAAPAASSNTPFDPFSAFSSRPSASSSTTPQPAAQSMFSSPTPAYSDPFAALSSLSKPTSPQPSAPAAQPPPAAAELAGSTAGPRAQSAATTNNNDDDEWSFSSALPPEAAAPAKPKEHRATVHSSTLKIDMVALRDLKNAPNAISLMFAFSNTTSKRIDELHFQLAVTKGFELALKPQSGRALEPMQSRGVMQQMQVWHAGNKEAKVDSVKLRWRVAYKLGGEQVTSMGDIGEFIIA
ncbi:VHS domain-containing protein [Zalerion maritima]|uniref:VHS domain-containing protein n=1 Tax=Zalerion maritima TaxID=339359 RepID=A0AAD5WR07_9PEZI|nr:VHS domain-containing protein [Zalerion maritima]